MAQIDLNLNHELPERLEQHYKQLVVSNAQLQFDVTEDIKNENGALLVKSGKNIDQRIYQKILQHKLLKPLDSYLRFINQLTPSSIVDDVMRIGSQALADTRIDFDATVTAIGEFVKAAHYDKTMLNKLTVYKYDSPDKFDHSLSTALLSAEMGKALNFRFGQLVDLFSVCLFHDIGEMHIEKSIYDKAEFDDSDYKAVKIHPVVSYVVMRESQTYFKDEVLQGVLSHHERMDKSGYPRGLEGDKINVHSRILALVDTYDAIRRKGRSVEDALWAIKIQSMPRSITGEAMVPAFDPGLIEILETLLNREAEDSLCANDPNLAEQKNQFKDLMLTLNSINDDVLRLWGTIQSCLQQAMSSANLKELQQAQSYLHKVKDLILASSGVIGVNVDAIAEHEDEFKDTRKDVLRMIPELNSQLARINGTLKPLARSAEDKTLVELVALNQAVYQKTGELYRSTIVKNTLH